MLAPIALILWSVWKETIDTTYQAHTTYDKPQECNTKKDNMWYYILWVLFENTTAIDTLLYLVAHLINYWAIESPLRSLKGLNINHNSGQNPWVMWKHKTNNERYLNLQLFFCFLGEWKNQLLWYDTIQGKFEKLPWSKNVSY